MTTMQECEDYIPVGKTMYFVHYLLEAEDFSHTICETIEEAEKTLSTLKSFPDFTYGFIVVGQRI